MRRPVMALWRSLARQEASRYQQHGVGRFARNRQATVHLDTLSKATPDPNLGRVTLQRYGADAKQRPAIATSSNQEFREVHRKEQTTQTDWPTKADNATITASTLCIGRRLREILAANFRTRPSNRTALTSCPQRCASVPSHSTWARWHTREAAAALCAPAALVAALAAMPAHIHTRRAKPPIGVACAATIAISSRVIAQAEKRRHPGATFDSNTPRRPPLHTSLSRQTTPTATPTNRWAANLHTAAIAT